VLSPSLVQSHMMFPILERKLPGFINLDFFGIFSDIKYFPARLIPSSWQLQSHPAGLPSEFGGDGCLLPSTSDDEVFGN
jgi:hypothetical protein